MPDKQQLEQFIKKFGLEVINNQKKALQKNDSVSTSNLLNSISFNYKVSVEGVIFKFISDDYGQYVDKGRKAGSFPPISKLKEWTKRKGLPEQAAFPIAKKIYKFGIKPKPFLMVGFDKNKTEFLVNLIKLYDNEIKSSVKDTFKAG